jgi:carboxyl-terminal processing protease
LQPFILSLLLSITSLGCKIAPAKFNSKLAWQLFDQFFTQDYAYLDTSGVEVDTLIAQYKAKALLTTNESDFVNVAQVFMRYFRDPHLSIYPSSKKGYSVTPTGADIWADAKGGKYFIVDLKAGSAASKSGLAVKSEIVSVDGLTAKAAIRKVFGGITTELSIKQKVWGLNIALGGIKNQPRVITVNMNNQEQTYQLAATYDEVIRSYNDPTLSFKKINNLGYIRFNNSLGNNETVDAFNNAIEQLIDTDGLVLDLRNIPSGGNTAVAEPILGHFVEQETVYQLYQRQLNGIHFSQAEMESATAKPSSPYYSKPFVVLVGRWTGSIGEGMMIGFDTLGAKAIIGAPVADLLGGIKNVALEQSNTVVDIAFERMFHVNGTYRENFEASIKFKSAEQNEEGIDLVLATAIEVLNKTAND